MCRKSRFPSVTVTTNHPDQLVYQVHPNFWTNQSRRLGLHRRMDWPVVTQPDAAFTSPDDGEWLSGICDCCQDKKQSCFACCCCPCFACRTTKQFGHALCLPLLDMCSGLHPVTMSMRLLVRRRYGIRGSLCRDCVCATCCLTCVWCQMAREMKLRELPTTLGDIIDRR